MSALFRKKEDNIKPQETHKAAETNVVQAVTKRRDLGVLKYPHLTEKATKLQSENTYVFIVNAASTKPGVREAVEKKYNVKVSKVRIVNLHGKRMRQGQHWRYIKGSKKAIVTLRPGDKLELV